MPDLIGRDFTATAINQKWCGDLTEIPTLEGKLYLAIVEDLASRRLAGFAIGEHHDAELAKVALCMATALRGGQVAGVIFHSDKGGEYTGDLFAKACRATWVRQSMGRVGSALDNAAAESFNSPLEFELLSRQVFVTKDQARREVAGFIDHYNHRRRHSSAEDGPRRLLGRPRRPNQRLEADPEHPDRPLRRPHHSRRLLMTITTTYTKNLTDPTVALPAPGLGLSTTGISKGRPAID